MVVGEAPRGRYGGRSAADRRAERREKWLAAGLELYGTEGYAATSIERLCETAGLSTRQFYEEFRNRNQLLIALYDQVNDAAAAAVGAAVTEALTAGAGLREMMRRANAAYVASIADDPRRAQLAFVTIVGVSPEVEEHRLARRRQWAETLQALADDAVARGEIPRRDFSLFMQAYVGAVNGLVHDWCRTDREASPDDIADTLTHLLYSALSAPTN